MSMPLPPDDDLPAREHCVNSWAEVQEALFEDAWRDDLQRFRSTHAYRGAGDLRHGLETTLARLGSGARELERHILRAFRKYAHHLAVPSNTTWHWLMLGQHHGLPTRLLDWSYSPYVALHFATEREADYDKDAAIWKIDYARANAHLPPAWKQRLDEESVQVFTTELLEREARDFDDLDVPGGPVLLFLEPPSLDMRIVNQFALFSLLSSPEARLEDWLRDHPGTCTMIRIPAGLKWEIRDKLDQANITERVLYPGLDGLARWIARYYRPGPPRIPKPDGGP